MKLIISKLLIYLTFLHHIKCEYFSTIAGLEDLLDAENHFINSVEEYFNNVIKVNSIIESFLNEVELEHEEILKNTNKYHGDPINAFKIIKRLVLDWKHIDDLTKMVPEYEAYNKSVKLPVSKFTPPTHEDLQGAARGLIHLQKIYKLHTEDLAEGYIRDYKYSEELSAHDCFILAKSLYESGEYLYASDWLMEAMKILDNMNEQDDKSWYEYPFVTHIEILEYLGAALYNAGNRKLASFMNYQLLEMDPKNNFGLTNKDLYEKGVLAERRVRNINNPKTQNSEIQLDAMKLYAKVCNNELQQTPAEKRPLRCRYVTNNVPFYFIGPLKLEELNRDPFVAYYHQTIYDSEIEEILENVEGEVKRSRVGSFADVVQNQTRINKSSWLKFEQHEFLSNIYQRLEDITGLSLATSEPLQVENYGIGDHYGPHYDFSNPESDYNGSGKPFLTALFYINDVEMGGATAFPFLNLAVPPIKYSLLVWYNMYKSLEHDYRAKHAECPVLKGSKWICTELIHAVGQEFKRPYNLKPDGEISIPFRDHIWD